MIWQADLHSHSTASDGQYTPTQLVRLAQQAGVQCLALTDHDTLAGGDEAQRAGEEIGLRVLRGVELGAAEDRHLHIVGLALRSGPSPLAELCEALRRGRDERKYRIVDFLAEKGVQIPLDEVEALAGGGVVARPHFAQVMVAHGFVATTREAFDRYLDTSEYQRIERVKASAEQCVQAIHSAGGRAVLAHPYQLGWPDDKLEALIRTLAQAGLDALECYYPRHTPEQTQQYLAWAQKYGLHVSGGNDFHGPAVHPGDVIRPIPLELDWLLQP